MTTPLPIVAAPRVDALESAIAVMHAAARALGEARGREQQLEDERALVKRDAILRLLDSKAATSATAAEKIVEQDETYAAHRAAQREAVINALVADAAYEAARLRARWAVVRSEEDFPNA